MDRVFLDANVLFSAAYKPDARVFQLWKVQDILLCSSRYALEEARRNLLDETQRRRLDYLATRLRFSEASAHDLPPTLKLPEKNVPILLAAITVRADYLLTGDFAHLGPYFGKEIRNVTILLPARYLKLKKR